MKFFIKKWKNLLLSILTGVIYCISFPGFDQWYLVWFSYIPLLFAIESSNSSKEAFIYGFVMGIIGNCIGYYWLPYTIHVFGGFNYPLTYFFFSILISYQAIFFGLFSFLVWKSLNLKFTYKGFYPPFWLSVPSIMVILELIYPLLFPIYVANTLHSVPVLIQIVDIGGPLLLTFIIMYVNSSLYLIIKEYLHEKRINKKYIVSIVAVLTGLILYGVIQISYQRYKNRKADSIKVGIVQANMGIYEKWQNIEEGLRRHRKSSYELEQKGVDLIIWPEASYVNHKICGGKYPLKKGELPNFYICITGGCNCQEEYKREIKDVLVPGIKTPILFGAIARREGRKRYHEFNSVFILDSDGKIKGFYDKKYLLAFGEYIPFGETFPQLYRYSRHTGRFTSGNLLNYLPYKKYRIGALICYEDILPFYTRKLVNATNPHLLVNFTNDAWFGDSTEPWIHLALAKFRAVEHHLWLIRATNTGVSAIIDSTGKVTVHSGVFVQQNIVGYVRLFTSFTLYRIIGDGIGWLLLILYLFIFGYDYIKKRRQRDR